MEIRGNLGQEQIINYLEKWFEGNKKLPNKINRIVLTRFYYCMKMDIEETKKLLEINYGLRNKSPEMFIDHDPADEVTRNSFASIYDVPLPLLTPENYRITYVRFRSLEPRMMNFLHDCRLGVMINDCRFSMPDAVVDDIPVVAEGEILLLDLAGYKMQHMARISLRTMRTVTKFLLQGYAVLMRGIHLINCPSYLNRILALMKPFLSNKIYEMIHIHTNDLTTLYEYIPREVLPEECGGYCGKLDDLSAQVYEGLLRKRDYLMDPKYWKIEEP